MGIRASTSALNLTNSGTPVSLSSRPSLGVIVVGYHSSDDLDGFCRSLQDADPDLDITVAVTQVQATSDEVNHGMELTSDLTFHPFIRLAMSVHDTSNIGYAKACNLTALYSPFVREVDVLAFFNADTRIRPGVLESCVDLLVSDPTYAVVGPRQVDDSNHLTHAGIFGSLDAPRHRGWKEPAGDRYTDVRDDAVTVSGSAYFIKRTIWNELSNCSTYNASCRALFPALKPEYEGAFLPTFLYYEETWISYHAQAHGYKVVYNGEATMNHQWHAAISKMHDPQNKVFFESREAFRQACDDHHIPHD